MLLIVRQKLESSDSILKHLVRGHTYRGSYYGGVKVGSADEFDIDIHLKLPLEYSQILVTLFCFITIFLIVVLIMIKCFKIF